MKIFALVTDLFFKGRIEETARNAGVEIEFASNPYQTKGGDLVIVDLQKFGSGGIFLIRERNRESVIAAYLPHIDIDLKNSALEAGCNPVFSRSEFTKKLPGLLKKSP